MSRTADEFLDRTGETYRRSRARSSVGPVHLTVARPHRVATASPAARTPGSSSNGILELQRTAGNKAVVAMLQRDSDEPAATHRGTVAVTFSGLGTVRAASIHFPHSAPAGAGGGQRAPGPTSEAMREVGLFLELDARAVRVQNAANAGTVFETVVIELPAGSVVLTDVVVSSGSLSAARDGAVPSESITLSAASAHVDRQPGP